MPSGRSAEPRSVFDQETLDPPFQEKQQQQAHRLPQARDISMPAPPGPDIYYVPSVEEFRSLIDDEMLLL